MKKSYEIPTGGLIQCMDTGTRLRVVGGFRRDRMYRYIQVHVVCGEKVIVSINVPKVEYRTLKAWRAWPQVNGFDVTQAEGF